MRACALALAILITPLAARAAPTCVTRQGDTVHCNAPGAMPVGWTLPDAEQIARRAAQPQGPGALQLAGLAAFLAGLLALILLLPDFQGRWDRQDGDDQADRGQG
jgi:hypothetical protein